jgi:hypothetical protein
MNPNILLDCPDTSYQLWYCNAARENFCLTFDCLSITISISELFLLDWPLAMIIAIQFLKAHIVMRKMKALVCISLAVLSFAQFEDNNL